MLGKEALEAYVLQLLQGVSVGSMRDGDAVAFITDDGLVFLQRGGQHFRVVIQPITLETHP